MQRPDELVGTELAVRIGDDRAAGAGSVMILTERDDSPLWLAWQTAQETWLASKRRRSGRENTVRAYALAVRQFFSFAGVAPWDVQPTHAQQWAMEMSLRCSPATVALRLAALSSLYDFVQRRYTVTRPDGVAVSLWPADRANPFVVVERPHISPYGRAVYPSTDELKRVLGAINTRCLTGKRDFALLYTIATTCRRSSEVTNLRWGDLRQLRDGRWSFKYIYKGGKLRRAVMDGLAYQAICAYLAADGRPAESMQAEWFVFVPLHPERIAKLRPGEAIDPNRPISNHMANAILKKYARRAGVDPAKAHIHGLRHAGARLRVEQMKAAGRGVDYMEIMQLLGHSSLAVTQIYSQTCLEDPEDPGGKAAAAALLPTGDVRRRRKPAGEQGTLL